MMNIEKIKSYSRRAGQMRYWPALFDLMKRKVVGPSKQQVGQQAAEAMAWCRQVAQDADANVSVVGFDLSAQQSFSADFAHELAAAEARVASGQAMGGGANLPLLYELCEQTKAMRVLETGVAAGWSTLAILLSLKKRPGARLDSVDMPYLGRLGDDDVGIAVPDHLKSHWTLHRFPDRQALPKILRNGHEFDLVHYDSDKSYQGRSWAYRAIWAHVRAGGVFVSDDIQDNMAFADFVRDLKLEPWVLRDPKEEKYAGILRKPL